MNGLPLWMAPKTSQYIGALTVTQFVVLCVFCFAALWLFWILFSDEMRKKDVRAAEAWVSENSTRARKRHEHQWEPEEEQA